MTTVNEQPKPAATAPAASKPADAANVFEGTLVSVAGSKLVMTNKEGKESHYMLTNDARFTCDGTVCQAGDLQAGRRIRVTTATNDRGLATGIESLNAQAAIAV